MRVNHTEELQAPLLGSASSSNKLIASNIFAISLVVILVLNISYGSTLPCLWPLFKDSIGKAEDHTKTTMLYCFYFSSYAIGQLVASLLFRFLYKWVSSKLLVCFALLASVGGHVAQALALRFAILVVGRALSGFAMGALLPLFAVLTGASREAPPSTRARVFTALNLCSPAGAIAGPLAAAALTRIPETKLHIGHLALTLNPVTAPFWLSSGIGTLVFLVFLIFYRVSPGVADQLALSSRKSDRVLSFKGVSPYSVAPILAAAFVMAVLQGATTLLFPWLYTVKKDKSTILVSWQIEMAATGLAFAALLGHVLARVLSERRWVPDSISCFLFCGTVAAGAGIFTFFGENAGLIRYLAGMALICFAAPAATTTLSALVGVIGTDCDRCTCRAAAMLNFACNIVSIVSPLLMGVLWKFQIPATTIVEEQLYANYLLLAMAGSAVLCSIATLARVFALAVRAVTIWLLLVRTYVYFPLSPLCS